MNKRLTFVVQFAFFWGMVIFIIQQLLNSDYWPNHVLQESSRVRLANGMEDMEMEDGDMVDNKREGVSKANVKMDDKTKEDVNM